jgi:hypothetical protein
MVKLATAIAASAAQAHFIGRVAICIVASL